MKFEIGKYVSFKADIETCGKIVAVRGTYVEVEVDDGEGPSYTMMVAKNKCWFE